MAPGTRVERFVRNVLLAGLLIMSTHAPAQFRNDFFHLPRAECKDQFLKPDVNGNLRIAPRLSEIKEGRITEWDGQTLAPPRPRAPHPRPNIELLKSAIKRTSPPKPNYVEISIKFLDDSMFQAVEGRLRSPDGRDERLKAIGEKFPQFHFAGSSMGERANISRFCVYLDTGEERADMTSYFGARIPDGQQEAAIQLLEELLQHPLVETGQLLVPFELASPSR
jgi:hypothetical protein